MLEDLSEYVDSQEFSLQESHEDCEGHTATYPFNYYYETFN